MSPATMPPNQSLFSGNNGDSLPTSEAKDSMNKRKWIVIDDDEENLPKSDDEIEEEDIEIDVKPIGIVVRVSGEGQFIKNHFTGFQADAISYNLEDTVLVSPQGSSFNVKPSVVIIKDITATQDGNVTVIGQTFYRPELAEKENGENWKTSEARELFYSFDKDEFPADAVMHKCVVHFVPPDKKIPSAKEHPGFIVRNVYNLTSKKLSGLLDTNYAASQRNEIDVLIKKTFDRIPNWKEWIRS
ncbi:protein REPRESSOR OF VERNALIZATION 1-like [Rutidosis leptorrhynchoides]|uniref:protein REPRESSOR OF VERNALIZATION 1-like n=1 Tax=Rutidosis leptorrhynchoides TaxID=125765 RepID=UPI003A98DC54